MFIRLVVRAAILAALLVLLTAAVFPAAFAQTMAPDDPVAILTYLGLGQYAAGIMALVGLAGYVLAHLMAWGWIPAPAAGAVGAWPAIYKVLNFLAANYGKATNAGPLKGLMLAVVLGGMLSLTACATSSGTSTTPATVVSDVATISAALEGALPQLAAIPGVSMAAVQPIVDGVQAAASQISATMALTQSQPLVTQIGADVGNLATVLAAAPLPPNVKAVVTAAQVLLPVVELAVGLAAPASATPSGMTPDQARLILKAAAAH